MDWRNRDYYLVTTDPFSYEMRHKYYKIASSSLKSHSPYNCLRYNEVGYETTRMKYIQEMLSCKKAESGKLEYELNKAMRNDKDGLGSYFFKLSKEICGQ